MKNDSSNKSISNYFSESPKISPHSSSSGLTVRPLYHITGVDTCVTERSSYWPAGETPARVSDCGDTTWIFTFSRHNNSQHRILHTSTWRWDFLVVITHQLRLFMFAGQPAPHPHRLPWQHLGLDGTHPQLHGDHLHHHHHPHQHRHVDWQHCHLHHQKQCQRLDRTHPQLYD